MLGVTPDAGKLLRKAQGEGENGDGVKRLFSIFDNNVCTPK